MPRGRRSNGDDRHPIDVQVGSRIRLRRNMLGMGQVTLARALGLTFQQIQKYERGANRISASRLFEIGQKLEVPVGYFFGGLAANEAEETPTGFSEAPAEPFDSDLMSRQDSRELVAAYRGIETAALRRRLFEFGKALASLEPRARK